MYTAAAARSRPSEESSTVSSLAVLLARGWSDSAVRSQLRARRWQRLGRAVVLHNGEPARHELTAAALINHGPRSVLTSFTAAERAGLAGWLRDEIHVLVPGGARVISMPGVRTHWTGQWSAVRRWRAQPVQMLGPALVIAAGSFTSPRPACGIFAAAVQQRLVRPADMHAALVHTPRARHRAVLLLAVADIAQGSHSLGEIDFVTLCRRHGLPEPLRQAVRREPDGRRRYLDAEWRRRDGRRVCAEVDGALHLAPRRWWDDQARQNELTIADSLTLRFPSVVIRTDEHAVADQLRRALAC